MGALVIVSFEPKLRSFINVAQGRLNVHRSLEEVLLNALEELQNTHNDKIGV